MKTPVALGFRASRGGSVVAAVGAGPQLMLSTFLTTAAEGDRLSLEPYHIAAQIAHDDLEQAAAAVREGRKRQDRLAAQGLTDIIRILKDSNRTPVVAALLVNRAGWVTDLLQYSIGAPEHPPVAEGLAVRDALRFAIHHCGIALVEMDEKLLSETASAALGLSSGEIDARLKALGQAKPWRKEQKLACLSAWLALTTR